MSRRFNLRQFQTELSRRLQAAAATPAESSRLGFLSGGQHWLVSLSDIDEVLPVPEILTVPGAQGWFRGLTNIRGNLYAVSDLGAWLTGSLTPESSENRLILSHRKHGINAALLVQKALGLKPATSAMNPVATSWPWASAITLETDGSDWHEIHLDGLLAETGFLTIEA